MVKTQKTPKCFDHFSNFSTGHTLHTLHAHRHGDAFLAGHVAPFRLRLSWHSRSLSALPWSDELRLCTALQLPMKDLRKHQKSY